MSQCKECGVTLPEGAKFCLQCGTDAPDAARPGQVAQSQQDLDFLKPALAGGLALGLLSTIPLIAYGNCVCCMWVLGGGGLTAYLLNQQRPGLLTYGDGAFGGVIAGLVGAVVGTIVSIPVRWLSAAAMAQQREQLEEMFRRTPDFPPAMKNLMDMLLSSQVTAAGLLFGFIISALMYGLIAMIGGILTVALLNRKKAG